MTIFVLNLKNVFELLNSENIKINGKEIFICEHHHHVIYHWNKFKKLKPYLLTFDHHTDTRPAFQNYLYHNRILEKFEIEQSILLEKIKINDFDTILKLKNDEHIDASIKSGIFKKALILSDESNSSKPNRIYTINGNEDYKDEPIIVNPRSFDEFDLAIETTNLKNHFRKFELCIPQTKWIDNFILDIDLDYFKTAKSVKPKDVNFFQFLAKKAITITIAKEKTWIGQWKEQYDENLNIEFLLHALLNIIIASL
jgi:hypothetical protein